jgi:hypothetical protein
MERKSYEAITAPKKNAGGSISICKYCRCAKDIYFSLQMATNIVSLNKLFG